MEENKELTLVEKVQEEEKRKADTKQALLNVYKMAATYYYYQMYNTPKGKIAYDYLKGRNLSDETIKKFRLGYDLERKALVIPYNSSNSYYITRSIESKRFYKLYERKTAL